MKRQDGVKESSQAHRYAQMLEALKSIQGWNYGPDESEPMLPLSLTYAVDDAIEEASKIGASE